MFQHFPLFSRKAAQFYLAELHRAHAFQRSGVIPSLSNTPTLTLTISALCCGQIPATDRPLVEKATAFYDTSNKKSCFLDFWLLLSDGRSKHPLRCSWQETCDICEEDSQHWRVIWDKSSETPCPLIRRLTLSLPSLAADAIPGHGFMGSALKSFICSPSCLPCCYYYQFYSHCLYGPAF